MNQIDRKYLYNDLQMRGRTFLPPPFIPIEFSPKSTSTIINSVYNNYKHREAKYNNINNKKTTTNSNHNNKTPSTQQESTRKKSNLPIAQTRGGIAIAKSRQATIVISPATGSTSDKGGRAQSHEEARGHTEDRCTVRRPGGGGGDSRIDFKSWPKIL